MDARQRIRVGTRGSRLSRVQTSAVCRQLRAMASGLEIDVVPVTTAGDCHPTKPVHAFGSTGIFTSELEAALLRLEIDVAVHSLKDLPTTMHEDLTLAAILCRDDAKDVLVTTDGMNLNSLPSGARLGTSSARRTRMLHSLRSDFEVAPMRGNVDTRIRRMREAPSECRGLVLAACGLTRIDQTDGISDEFPLATFLTAPGQGAIALQVRKSDHRMADLVQPLDHMPTRLATRCERALLHGLGGGCALPAAAYATATEGRIHLRAHVRSPDGQRLEAFEASGTSAWQLGMRAADALLARGVRKWLTPVYPV